MNPTTTDLLGPNDIAIQRSLKFLEKMNFVQRAYIDDGDNPLVEPIGGWVDSDISEAFLMDFRNISYNYSDMHFYDFKLHDIHMHSGMIDGLSFKLFEDLIIFLSDISTGFPEFINIVKPLETVEEISVNFDSPEYFTNMEGGLYPINFLDINYNEFEDFASVIPNDMEFFFEKYNFPLNLGQMHDILIEYNILNNINLNFMNYNNSIALIYNNVRSIKIGDSLLPFYSQLNDFENLTTLNEMNVYFAGNRRFNTEFKLEFINIFHQYSIHTDISMIIFNFSYNSDHLSLLNLIN